MEIVHFKIKGMTCDKCAQSIEKVVTKHQGIIEKEVSYPKATGRFVFDPDTITPEEIKKTINDTSHYQVVGEITNNDHSSNFDFVIVGGGSAAFSAALTANDKGAKVLIINDGLPVGGTCVNVGCIPSKRLIRVAERIHQASENPFVGIQLSRPKINFKKIIQNKNQLVETLRTKKYYDVIKDKPGIHLLKSRGIIHSRNQVKAGDKTYTAKKILIATGASTRIPDIKGIEKVDPLTHIDLFKLEELPASLTILGAGYIGLEMATVFNRMGSHIRILEFTDRPLRSEMPDISHEIQKQMEAEGIEFYPNHRIDEFIHKPNGMEIHGKNISTGEAFVFHEEGKLVVATGIKANTKHLGLDEIGIEKDAQGHIVVNTKQETNIPGIYAAGDVTNTPAFVYTAAAEGRTAALNAIENADMETHYTGLPWVVFTDPQVAGAGIDEKEAAEKGIAYEISKINLTDIPRAIAANDMRGFIKLIRNPETDALLGIRIVAPEGGELVMQASLAIKYGISVSEIADSLHPYLTLSEGIKLTAIAFHKSVGELSCCAI